MALQVACARMYPNVIGGCTMRWSDSSRLELRIWRSDSASGPFPTRWLETTRSRGQFVGGGECLDERSLEARVLKPRFYCRSQVHHVDLVARFELAWDGVTGPRILDRLSTNLELGRWSAAARNEIPVPGVSLTAKTEPQGVDHARAFAEICGRHSEDIDDLRFVLDHDLLLGIEDDPSPVNAE